MKHKSEVVRWFQDFHKLVATQFEAKIRILRSDNGTEYVNREVDAYISEHGIIHQTTCVGTGWNPITEWSGGKGKEEPTSAGGGTVTYVLDKCAKEFLE